MHTVEHGRLAGGVKKGKARAPPARREIEKENEEPEPVLAGRAGKRGRSSSETLPVVKELSENRR